MTGWTRPEAAHEPRSRVPCQAGGPGEARGDQAEALPHSSESWPRPRATSRFGIYAIADARGSGAMARATTGNIAMEYSDPILIAGDSAVMIGGSWNPGTSTEGALASRLPVAQPRRVAPAGGGSRCDNDRRRRAGGGREAERVVVARVRSHRRRSGRRLYRGVHHRPHPAGQIDRSNPDGDRLGLARLPPRRGAWMGAAVVADCLGPVPAHGSADRRWSRGEPRHFSMPICRTLGTGVFRTACPVSAWRVCAGNRGVAMTCGACTRGR